MADPETRSGARHATGDLLAWVNELHVPHDPPLVAAFEAPDTHGLPAIQVGPSEGRFMSLLLKLVGARKVVEIGTLAGYSAIHLARALPIDGHLWTIEREVSHADVARHNLDLAGLAGTVTVIVGLALDVLPTLETNAPFDAVFLDADKGNYDRYGRWAARTLRPGGLLLGDNAHFFGRLLDEDPDAEAMRRWHEEAREAFETVCIPTPDGLLLGVKR